MGSSILLRCPLLTPHEGMPGAAPALMLLTIGCCAALCSPRGTMNRMGMGDGIGEGEGDGSNGGDRWEMMGGYLFW